MTKRELRKYKKNHCYHSCYHCEWKKQCWDELGVEENDVFNFTNIMDFIILPMIIGFLFMVWLIYLICCAYMM